MPEARLLIWASVDRRDDRVQLIVDDCRAIDDLRLLFVDLLAEQAGDIEVQHRLRECLHQHRLSHDELGMRVPVVAAVRDGDDVRYVKLGNQFCVRDVQAAASSLVEQSFSAKCSESLLV